MRADSNSYFRRGRPRWVEALWMIASALPGFRLRAAPAAFWAKIGAGVVIKPLVVVKFPWNLEIGDDVCIGQRV
ncbi:hypothetical protein JMM61_18675 [Rhodovulum sulfidophilum]|uniref:hypothetical protein n=1 Tax=Rhodovulum sulfidophilum TaxID=35806 RepID=UPI00192968A8|nr:hypothetical protein [Rhodovulum sulfidophilum]MBL3587379.1 hypothetical protein [Rhodovulum sulfidophilum]